MRQVQFLKKLDAIIGPLLARILPSPPSSSETTPTPNNPQRLLFIRPGGIGDAVLLLPVLQGVKKQYPEAELVVLAERRNAGAFALSPVIDTLLCYDNWRDWRALVGKRYDIVVDTEQSHYLSAVIARLLRTPKRVGFATNSRERLFHMCASYSHADYEIDSFVRLARVAGFALDDVPRSGFVTLADEVRSQGRKLLEPLAGRDVAVIFPGASIAARRWEPDKFRQLAKRFIADGYAVVVVGGDVDRENGAAVLNGLEHSLNLAGKTSLLQTAAVLNNARILVTGDSGVMHLAAAVGCPTVALFGPGIVEKWAPRTPATRVVNLDLACSPCTRFGTTPKCPYNERCMRDIGVGMVWDAVQDVLE
jgi:lipopolysaccharide heptosyltransferase II